MSQITVVGGGLAGLVSSILLCRKGLPVTLIEKKRYPFHRVCGEYISNEVLPFLIAHDLYPENINPASISSFMLTSVNGSKADLPLDLGGFGISRYALDHFLYEQALAAGVEFYHETVTDITLENNGFKVITERQVVEGQVVIGAYGKRSRLDKKFDRDFIKKRSPYIGVKYHIRYDAHPRNAVALHNFKGGYCGISRVEDEVYNLCYLSERTSLKVHGQIDALEKEVLAENPFLEDIFNNAEFLWDKPEVINEISFETKQPVEKNVLMCGDAAGMITPLCGNGMAIAIHTAKLVAEIVTKHITKSDFSRDDMEREYALRWNALFKNRLRTGRQIQHMFGAPWLSNTAVGICRYARPVANYLMSKTHGTPFH
ncbi:NAD(P)/FAD-dependent oxidoreductase [Fulvivirga sp. M361]|uniref:NAD(P)/FAD-dependent oxidoreductase n=1 Tax=Fulvivirga sp. M361 TaxID=2594266 RepID=UPI00117AEE98|nr:NAD(P)/FAD-dependent oxidoreductase [Fulvivirga sp. M361]TRX62722.1 NAD(P)/FAD-dependent oxidoreductase [Fulvivirga sp. M361]